MCVQIHSFDSIHILMTLLTFCSDRDLDREGLMKFCRDWINNHGSGVATAPPVHVHMKCNGSSSGFPAIIPELPD